MSQKELITEIQKGFDSIQAGNDYTAAKVDAMLKEEFGIQPRNIFARCRVNKLYSALIFRAMLLQNKRKQPVRNVDVSHRL